MTTNPITSVKNTISILRQLAREHEEFLPNDDRVTRYRMLVQTARDNLNDEPDEVTSAIVSSDLNTEIDVTREVNFHAVNLFQELDRNSIAQIEHDLEPDEARVIKILDLILEAQKLTDKIDEFRKNGTENELPADIDEHASNLNLKLIENIDLIFDDVDDRKLVLDSIKEMNNEWAFFTLLGFYDSQVLKLLKGLPLVI